MDGPVYRKWILRRRIQAKILELQQVQNFISYHLSILHRGDDQARKAFFWIREWSLRHIGTDLSSARVLIDYFDLEAISGYAVEPVIPRSRSTQVIWNDFEDDDDDGYITEEEQKAADLEIMAEGGYANQEELEASLPSFGGRVYQLHMPDAAQDLNEAGPSTRPEPKSRVQHHDTNGQDEPNEQDKPNEPDDGSLDIDRSSSKGKGRAIPSTTAATPGQSTPAATSGPSAAAPSPFSAAGSATPALTWAERVRGWQPPPPTPTPTPTPTPSHRPSPRNASATPSSTTSPSPSAGDDNHKHAEENNAHLEDADANDEEDLTNADAPGLTAAQRQHRLEVSAGATAPAPASPRPSHASLPAASNNNNNNNNNPASTTRNPPRYIPASNNHYSIPAHVPAEWARAVRHLRYLARVRPVGGTGQAGADAGLDRRDPRTGAPYWQREGVFLVRLLERQLHFHFRTARRAFLAQPWLPRHPDGGDGGGGGRRRRRPRIAGVPRQGSPLRGDRPPREDE
ncbi:hypothetical protein F4780DRAFT_785376 [Xylariomycetidae sp. FL0641]|nr:hypothetical protein F4780DRAFT_785376 [Xylariomycetidae sp. FL0641]